RHATLVRCPRGGLAAGRLRCSTECPMCCVMPGEVPSISFRQGSPMHYTIERLLNGDSSLVAHYQNAAKRWKEIFAMPESREIASLAALLPRQQMWFERNAGGRWAGQEVMAVSGFGILYTTENGFQEDYNLAQMLAQAFEASSCSIE